MATTRSVLKQMQVVYRAIPALRSGRRPVDFTIALVALRQLAPHDEPPAESDDEVARRWMALVDEASSTAEADHGLRELFRFSEADAGGSEVTFDFVRTLESVPRDQGHLVKLSALLAGLPEHDTDVDLFGEVYQAIGDDHVKRTLGEFYTGQHLIAGLLPLLFDRARITTDSKRLPSLRIADIACGTGGFLTGTLRHFRQRLGASDGELRALTEQALHGYDLNPTSAARTRANIAFLTNGQPSVHGGVDSLTVGGIEAYAGRTFDLIMTNPPYGRSGAHSRSHETFLARTLDLLTPGSGHGLVILPNGTLENPRSAAARFDLLRRAEITDVVSLPIYAFAPYTKQRTAAVIFRRRATDLQASSWPELLAQVDHEQISFFEVVHDGFANSEKRYPTRRRNPDGSWAHDDLAEWTDTSGTVQPSRLFAAAINGAADSQATHLSIAQMGAVVDSLGAERSRGVDLLPDTYLRSHAPAMNVEQFVAAVDAVEHVLRSSSDDTPIYTAVRDLLQTGITFAEPRTVRLSDLFTLQPGRKGLTEEVIYNSLDEDGIPIYGGGTGSPRVRISEASVLATGETLQVLNGPTITVSLDGSSGATQVVGARRFALTHHAVALIPTDMDVDLGVVAQQAESKLRQLASNRTASSTLTHGTILSLQIEIPSQQREAEAVRSARTRLTRVLSVIGR